MVNFYTLVFKVATLSLALLCARMSIVDVLQLDYSPITRLPGASTLSPFKKIEEEDLPAFNISFFGFYL